MNGIEITATYRTNENNSIGCDTVKIPGQLLEDIILKELKRKFPNANSIREITDTSLNVYYT